MTRPRTTPQSERLKAIAAMPRLGASRQGAKATLLRWLGFGLETHISLPLFAALLLILIWLAFGRFVTLERDGAAQAARASTEELIDTYSAQMARSLSSIDQTLKMIGYAVALKGPAAALPALRQRALLPSALVFSLSIANRDGAVLASYPPGAPSAAPAAIAALSHFTFHLDNAADLPFISAPSRPDAPEATRLYFSRRLNDAAGHFAGVVTLEVDPVYFTSGYEHGRLGELGALGLYGADGRFRALRVGDKVRWNADLAVPAVARTEAEPLTSTWDGVRRYTSTRRLHGFPLIAVVGLAESEQMAAFERHRRNYLWLATICSAALVLLVTLIGLWSWQMTRTRRRIARAQETYAAASEASLDAFFAMRSIGDASGTIVDFMIEATNSRAELLTGMRGDELCGKLLCQILPDCRNNGIFDDLLMVTIMGGVHEAEWETTDPRLRVKKWLHRQVVPIEGGVVAMVRDITERKRSEQRIHHMAHHDALTGLPNRSLIRDRLDQAILHARRNGRCVALAFIDLDGFKLVNDGLGHNAGDELLRVVGQRMADCLRSDDTLGRFGGDEFIIILDDQPDDPMSVAPVLEKVRHKVTEPIMLDGQEVRVSCSMGVVMYPRDGADPDTLITNADAAMYRAKELGNNNFQFYAREMNASVEEKLVLLEGLRGAVESCAGDDTQFHLLYQPKVDLRTNRVFGVEALIRWRHPQHGMISPLRFIGLAEESGLIVTIGEWVLQSACRQNMAWRAAGLAPITISVNVSARQFEEKRLVERVAQALAASALDPASLELEVTESLIMRDLAQSVGKMRELKAMGVSLSIDDFGTGYSSLSALKSFPISTLKIDRSFVSELADNPDDQAIALAVIALGHRLNLRVLAEGVETEQQRQFLLENDCDEMQGYLFSRPLPPDELAALLRRQADDGEPH
jgi:diguanylate cyclase (GGDEF)-like protein/PAS domain S-box-containing protein